MAEKCGCSILRIGDRDWTGYPPELVISYCPLHAAAPLTLAACKTALFQLCILGNVSTSAETTKDVLRDAIAAAEKKEE